VLRGQLRPWPIAFQNIFWCDLVGFSLIWSDFCNVIRV
jgi:hypothetical protein